MALLLTFVGRASSVDSTGAVLQSIAVSPSPGIIHLSNTATPGDLTALNVTQMAATGTYDDLSTQDIRQLATWASSDINMLQISQDPGPAAGNIEYGNTAALIWGGDVGITASLAPGTPGTASLLVVSSDSGSRSPRMPNQDNHWIGLGLSPWGSWWGLQEASGSDTLVGSGSAAFNLSRLDGTGGDGIGIRQNGTFTDWTRKCITISGSTAQRISAAAGVGPNPGSTSVGWLGYACIDSNSQSAASARIMGMCPAAAGNQSGLILTNQIGTNGAIRFLAQLGSKDLVGPESQRHNDRIHPLLFIYNRTTAEVWGFSDNVIGWSGSHAALTDDIKGFGARSATSPASSSWVWCAMATGSIVEQLCDPSASADFLTRLGWNVPWKTCPTDSGTIKLPFLDMHWKELGLQTWTATWNMQNSQQTLAQSSFDRWELFSSDGWAMSFGGTPTLESSADGWRRKAHVILQSSDNRVSRICTGQMLWNPTGSFAIIGYVSASVGAGVNRQIVSTHGTVATHQNITVSVTLGDTGQKKPVLYCVGNATTGTQDIVDSRYHPLMIVYDNANSRVKMYTDLEKITGSYTAMTLINSVTGAIGWGGRGVFSTPPPMGVLWGSFCTGTFAEQFSDDGKASDFLKKLGWSIPW